MIDSRKMKHRINSIHKRALKLVYQGFYNLTFQELLAKDYSEFMNDISQFMETPYNLRSNCTLERKRYHTICHDSERFSFPAPKLS